MKALTIRQPWAYAVISCGKNIENRSRPFSYRGPLAIHAGKSQVESEWARDFVDVWPVGLTFTNDDLVYGAIIGVVNLIDCVPYERVKGQCWAEGPWCLIFRNATPIEPISWRGMLGLFEVPDEVILSRCRS